MYLVYGVMLYIIFLLLVLSRKRVSKIYFILLGISPLILFYILSPNNRIYSYHGFMHTGIVYEILNKKYPLSNPLLGGQPLFYYWGYHYLAAWVSRIFNITPFYSFSFISIISLSLSLVLAYKISSLLIKDERSNLFSALISIFGITVFGQYLLMEYQYLSRELFPSRILYIKNIPLFGKFASITGDVIGFVSFLLFCYSIIRIFKEKKYAFYMISFLISILCCGFFYPGMLFGIAASTISVCLVMLFRKEGHLSINLRKAVLMLILLSTGILILRPYISSISLGVRENIQFFKFKASIISIIRYLIVSLPILTLIHINRKEMNGRLDREAMIILLTIISTTSCIYILIHLPWDNEYKFLMLSVLNLGIIGGIAFGTMSRWRNNFAVFILLFLFLNPSYYDTQAKIARLKNIPNICIEKGRYVYHIDKEENELHRWIRKNTSPDSIFVDSELTIPVFAHRDLFIGIGSEENGEKNLGYSVPIKDILLACGYDYNLIEKRRRIVKGIYDTTQKSLDKETEDFFSLNKDIYIVVRKRAIESKFNQDRFDRVFKSAEGNLLVYKPKNTGYSQRGL